ncbi:Bug family tripartite tricarboxylate transporter substrate binding protein [Siccirubricoccus phaeus]|uniref:Bug family tripartite tricarboxylate transporter substrate binding protein n=1 Tax=Siccirubricoccus phaeus TaxID=2595053 RepID=UPI0011F2AEBB|nr:tripartite tricarboxylate transporter substrate binding protein [Siccirubricoccus phaeus]
MFLTTRRAAFGAALLATGQLRAQSWPARSITWIVPFTPGGITDTSSRLVAQPLGAWLGQQVVIDNRPGAGGGIGTEAAARAAADGYTILYGTQGTLATNPVLYRNVRYDPLRDFAPVHGLAQTPLLLVVNPARPFRTLAELIGHAKERPGELTFATSGIGTGTHMAAELFQAEAGVKLTQVPYQGSAPALNDLVAGRTDLMFDYLISTRAFLESGRLRPLATTGSARLAALPEVPTLAEAGLPGAETASWSCIMAPAAVPAPIREKLAEGLQRALSEPRVVETLAGSGSAPLMLAGDGLRDFVGREVERWRGIVERSGARAG